MIVCLYFVEYFVTNWVVAIHGGFLRFEIKEARNLIPADLNGKSDPYCVFKIGSQNVYKTDFISETLFPVWNETFNVALAKLSSDKIRINVFDHDAIGSDDPLGHYELSVNQIVQEGCVSGWYSLKDVATGEINLTVTFVPPRRFSIMPVQGSTVSLAESSTDSLVQQQIGSSPTANGEPIVSPTSDVSLTAQFPTSPDEQLSISRVSGISPSLKKSLADRANSMRSRLKNPFKHIGKSDEAAEVSGVISMF